MAANNSTITFDVQDCKVYRLITDTASTLSYAPAVDVPGIQEVTVEANFVTAELKGDGGKVLAKKGKVDRLNFSCTYSELSLPVLDVIHGGATTANSTSTSATNITYAGTSNTETATYEFTGVSLPYFKVEFLINDIESDLAEVAVVLDKCQVTGGSLIGGSTDNFGNPSFDAEAILTENASKFGRVVFREAAAGLAT